MSLHANYEELMNLYAHEVPSGSARSNIYGPLFGAGPDGLQAVWTSPIPNHATISDAALFFHQFAALQRIQKARARGSVSSNEIFVNPDTGQSMLLQTGRLYRVVRAMRARGLHPAPDAVMECCLPWEGTVVNRGNPGSGALPLANPAAEPQRSSARAARAPFKWICESRSELTSDCGTKHPQLWTSADFYSNELFLSDVEK